MSKFEKGDRVVCVDATETPRLTKGKEYVILKASKVYAYLKADDYENTPFGYLPSRFKKITKERPMKPTNNTYTFNTPWSMVDFDLIEADLSYARPMAILQDVDGEGKVIVHTSIYEKSFICKLDTPHWRNFEFNNTTKGNIGVVKDWVKEVKRAAYPSSDKPKSITVQQLEVS